MCHILSLYLYLFDEGYCIFGMVNDSQSITRTFSTPHSSPEVKKKNTPQIAWRCRPKLGSSPLCAIQLLPSGYDYHSHGTSIVIFHGYVSHNQMVIKFNYIADVL